MDSDAFGMHFGVGDLVDGFLLEERLHQGGMASLWRVTHPDHRLPMLMKVPRIKGGEVIDVQVQAGCPFDDAGRRSLEAGAVVRIETPRTIADGAQTLYLGSLTESGIGRAALPAPGMR